MTSSNAWFLILFSTASQRTHPIPRVVIFFFLFPPSFSKAILKTGELPFLCNIVSFFHQLFVPRFTMAVFMCIYLHYIYCSRIHNGTRRSNYPQFSGFIFLFRHSSMVKPVLAGNFRNWDFYNYGELLFTKTFVREFIQCRAFLG